MIRFKRIGSRLLVSVCSVVIVGLVVMVLFYAVRQERVLGHEAEASLAKVTDSVAEGLGAIMVGGHAKVAPEFAARLKNVPNVVDYRILRPNGVEAFVDNETVDRVNERLGDYEFTGRGGTPPVAKEVLAESDPNLVRARETGERVYVYQKLPGGERLVTTLTPIKAANACRKCHGPDESVRGIIKLTTSLKEVDRDVERTWRLSIAVIVAALAAIIALIYWVAHQTVVSQIVDFSRAMETAATGDMSVRLPARGRDEIGHMARSFNQMNEQLLEIYAGLREEKNKLNTVIQGASSGIVVTDAHRRVVLVNGAAERILGKSAKQITEQGFAALFDDPQWMEERLARERDESVGESVKWNGMVLSVQISTICDSTGEVIGSAALIRDITEEKRLEAELKAQSITDALTGLNNRRYFDEALQTEFKRWQRYAQPLSVMMLDVDHFKRFNDTHGHECGDRVLTAIGEVLGGVVTPAVIPCRYGGEEMVVIMPGLLQAKASDLAERLRREIAELVIDGLKVTVSIGVAGVPGHAVEDGDALVKLADGALYEAKENGRNQVRVAQQESGADAGPDKQ